MNHKPDSTLIAPLKSPALKCLAILAFGVAPLTTWGAAIDTLTITQNGGNTQYAVKGTFPADFATHYGSPNAPYTLAFMIPTSPTSFGFVDSSFGVFGLDASVSLNGVTYPNSQVAFFTPFLGGGLDVCLNDICSPNPPTTGIKFLVSTDPIQIFTGSVDKPTLIAGTVKVDTVQSLIETPPVPEPGSMSLAALGGGVLVLGMRRKRRAWLLFTSKSTPPMARL